MLAERSHSATDFQGGRERERERVCVYARLCLVAWAL